MLISAGDGASCELSCHQRQRSHIFQMPTLRLRLHVRKLLKDQLRLLLALRKLLSSSYQTYSVYFASSGKIYAEAILPLFEHKWLKWSRVTSTMQRDTTCWGLELWLSLFYATYRQKTTKSLPTLKLDVTVSYVDHALQTCHVITSCNCVQLLEK